MTDLKRTLRLLLATELRIVGKILAPLGRRRRPKTPARKEVEAPPPPAPQPAPRHSAESPGLAALSYAFSILLHALLLAWLAAMWTPRIEKGVELPDRVMFRVSVAPILPPRAPEPLQVEAPPPSAILEETGPEESPRAPELDAPPIPGPEKQDIQTSDVADSEPARGLPVDKSTSLTDLAPPPLPNSLGLGSSTIPLPGIGNGVVRGFSTRGTGKGDALRRYGGNGTSESAVGRGLRWLAEHQDEDGGWSADGFQRHCLHTVPCTGKGLSDFNVGVTAIAALAFLGTGCVPDSSSSSRDVSARVNAANGVESPYRQNVTKAMEYLLARQDGQGVFGATGENYFYNHAIATFAMAEAHAMTLAPRYRRSLEAAVAFSAGAQQSGGGWDYTARTSGRNDLSITGWQVMALKTAAASGVAVPSNVLGRMSSYLDGAVDSSGQGVYSNLGEEAGRRGINMTAVGLLSRLYTAGQPEDGRVRRAADRLLREPPDWERCSDWERTFQSYYYWYTATLALFHLGGERWQAWNLILLRTLLPLQSRQTHELGSWPPEPSWIGMSGGRVYATATCVLTLEIYYRYEPLFKVRKS